MKHLLEDAAQRAIGYLEGLDARSVAPTPAAIAALSLLDRPLPEHPQDPAATLRELDAIGSPATMWCGPTVWQGKTAARISVSSWATTDDDVTKSIEAMLRVWKQA